MRVRPHEETGLTRFGIKKKCIDNNLRTMSKYDRFAKRFLPINGLVSEAAGRGGFACSGVPKNCYMIEVTRYYKMQFVRMKSLTNNKNMDRNQIRFNLKIKDA